MRDDIRDYLARHKVPVKAKESDKLVEELDQMIDSTTNDVEHVEEVKLIKPVKAVTKPKVKAVVKPKPKVKSKGKK